MFTCLLLSLQTGVDHTLLEGSRHCAVYESRFASYGREAREYHRLLPDSLDSPETRKIFPECSLCGSEI